MEPEDFDPPVGIAEQVAPSLRRIVAPNAGAMTFRGTNTYCLGERRLAVIDPGPNDDAHLEAILRAVGGAEVTHILVTHAHKDHSPLARHLSDATGAPIGAYGDARSGRSALMSALAAEGVTGGEGVDEGFAPDFRLGDGDWIETDEWELEALWTPGHMGNHLSLVQGREVFCGDLVMSWATSLISPPDGDVAAFRASCERLRDLAPSRLWPGHGAPVIEPVARIDWLLAHRAEREAQILAALGDGPATPRDLARAIYRLTPPALLRAAERNVFAHLADLTDRAQVTAIPCLAPDATYALPET